MEQDFVPLPKKGPQTSGQLQTVRNKVATTLFPNSLHPAPAPLGYPLTYYQRLDQKKEK